ncbi:MAG: Cupin domain protein [Verrucomicrobiales bacterium]|nr:Cupin domain protein [Verrucomicrobiales bacterium]
MPATKNFELVQLNELPGINCPCGVAQRAFADLPNSPCSVHFVSIENDARRHFHRQMTEVYVVLEGVGGLELDDELIPVKPLTTVMIKPGCRHRAIGTFKILNIAIPKFDPADEFSDP